MGSFLMESTLNTVLGAPVFLSPTVGKEMLICVIIHGQAHLSAMKKGEMDQRVAGVMLRWSCPALERPCALPGPVGLKGSLCTAHICPDHSYTKWMGMLSGWVCYLGFASV